MTATEFCIRLLVKLMLIAGVIVLIIGGCDVEGDSTFALRMMLSGIGMVVPDIAVWIIDGLYIDRED